MPVGDGSVQVKIFSVGTADRPQPREHPDDVAVHYRLRCGLCVYWKRKHVHLASVLEAQRRNVLHLTPVVVGDGNDEHSAPRSVPDRANEAEHGAVFVGLEYRVVPLGVQGVEQDAGGVDQVAVSPQESKVRRRARQIHSDSDRFGNTSPQKVFGVRR
jgi:hypothetical protein